MSIVYVEFTDGTHEKVGSVFSSPQNADDHPHYSELDSSDTRYMDFVGAETDNPFNEQTLEPKAS